MRGRWKAGVGTRTRSHVGPLAMYKSLRGKPGGSRPLGHPRIQVPASILCSALWLWPMPPWRRGLEGAHQQLPPGKMALWAGSLQPHWCRQASLGRPVPPPLGFIVTLKRRETAERRWSVGECQHLNEPEKEKRNIQERRGESPQAQGARGRTRTRTKAHRGAAKVAFACPTRRTRAPLLGDFCRSPAAAKPPAVLGL